jgi:SSS family transporter
MQANFTLFHYFILILYVLVSVTVGLWFVRGQTSVEGYYLAERSAPWWMVAISIVSSDISAISFLGCTAMVFTGDLQLFTSTLSLPLAALFTSLVFVPVLARHKVFTVYEYLERRFNLSVRTVASALFLLMRGSHLAVALFAASLVLAQVMGLPLWVSLLILGGLTTLYTMLGGMKAVLWTDVIQFFVLIGGLIAVLAGVAIAFDWDFVAIWRLASHSVPASAPWLNGRPDSPSHTRWFDFHAGFYELNFWAILLSGFFQSVGSYGSDQVLVQRYLAAGSRREMVVSLIGGSLLTVPINLLMFLSGAFLAAYYGHFLGTPGHAWIGGLTDPNRVMSHFITHGLPGTLGAIVIAALFAATMSSFSAGLNSLSTATYVDFIVRFGKKHRTERQGVFGAKVVTGLWGVAIMLGAIMIGGQDTIFAILAKVMGPFAGPLLGIFLLGILSPRANSRGVIIGALVGAGATLYVTYFTSIHWLWYYVVGTVVAQAAGYLLSLAWPERATPTQSDFPTAPGK